MFVLFCVYKKDVSGSGDSLQPDWPDLSWQKTDVCGSTGGGGKISKIKVINQHDHVPWRGEAWC